MIISILVFTIVVYLIWFAIANFKGKCPAGSKNSGFRSCIQSTRAYVPKQASKNPLKEGFYCSKDCSKTTWMECLNKCTQEKEGVDYEDATSTNKEECESLWECEKDHYYEKLPLGCTHTCVKPCIEGFHRRSNAAGSAFCDIKMKTQWIPFM